MRKIAVVLASLNVGGAESRMMDLLKVIDSNEFKFVFILLNKDPNQFYEAEAVHYGADIIKLNSPRCISIFRHIKELKDVFKAGQYSAVHANTSYHSGLVAFSAFLSKIKVRIVHARTNGLRNGSLKGKISEALGKVLIRLFATDRLAISPESAKYLYGNNKNVRIVPNAIDLEKYSSITSAEQNRIKEQIGVSPDCKIIGHVGRFDDAKNQMFLISVFKEMLNMNEKLVLILVGNGDKWEECKSISKALDIDKQIRFLGERKDVPALMGLFDVFVFPSKYEGLGNVAIEAQAAGTPCLCSDRVPASVDMGIGLVKFISLDEPTGEWASQINKMLKQKKADHDLVYESFIKREYTLNKSLEILCSIYGRGKAYE